MAPDQIYRFHSPYIGMGNNPIVFNDTDGRDIYFFDKNLNTIGVILTTGDDYGYKVDIDWPHGKFVYDAGASYGDGAFGLGVETSGTLMGGVNAGFEIILYTSGSNAYKPYIYRKAGVNIGLEAGIGVYGIAADYWGGDELNGSSWEGWYSGYSGGLGVISAGGFWGTDVNKPQLWQTGKLKWDGVTFGGSFFGQLKAGVKWSCAYSKLITDLKQLVKVVNVKNVIKKPVIDVGDFVGKFPDGTTARVGGN